MPSFVFADTSALFAALVRGGRHHADAAKAEALIRSRRDTLWTIDPVLTELWLLLRREVASTTCDTIVEGLLQRGLQRTPVVNDSYWRAWELARIWPDQQFSLTDRLSFDAIERSGRLLAWSYDDDFAIIRLGPRRTTALTLVR